MTYAIETFTLNGDAARFWRPNAATTGPTLIYCHGVGGNETEFSHVDYTDLRSWLHANGWGVLELNAGGPHWNNTAAQQFAHDAFVHIGTTWTTTWAAVFGRSMGGTIGTNLYLRDTAIAPLARGLILCSGVQDIMASYDATFTTSIRAAYGTTNRADTVTAVAADGGHSPIAYAETEYAGKRILFQTGDADTIVPAETHVLARRTSLSNLEVSDVDIVPGGDHYSTRPRSDAHIAFLSKIAPGGDVAAPSTFNRRVTRYLYTGGQRYTVGPKP